MSGGTLFTPTPFMHSPYLKAEATSTTVVIKICTACGQPAVDDLSKQGMNCRVYFKFSRLNTSNRRCTLPIALQASPTETQSPSAIFVILKFKRVH